LLFRWGAFGLGVEPRPRRKVTPQAEGCQAGNSTQESGESARSPTLEQLQSHPKAKASLEALQIA
jgi:hypothetical protein